jgi:hypothetical protein
VEFLSSVRGMCLNLEADNVCVSIFGNNHLIKECRYTATACAIYVPCALGFSTAHVRSENQTYHHAARTQRVPLVPRPHIRQCAQHHQALQASHPPIPPQLRFVLLLDPTKYAVIDLYAPCRRLTTLFQGITDLCLEATHYLPDTPARNNIVFHRRHTLFSVRVHLVSLKSTCSSSSSCLDDDGTTTPTGYSSPPPYRQAYRSDCQFSSWSCPSWSCC